MEHNKIIEVNNLVKSYNGVQVVKGVNFYVKRGQIFALLGTNGAGKSTVIDTLCTLLDYDSGEVAIEGYDVQKDAEIVCRRIGVVFQDGVLDETLSVKDNLYFRSHMHFARKDQADRAVDEVIRLLKLEEVCKKQYGRLSGGYKRRVDIAKALLNWPDILFLDEPTTGLDVGTRKLIWDTIYQLQKERDMTIVLTTHYMEEAAKAEHIVVMRQGEIFDSGTPLELEKRYAFDRAYLLPKNREKIVNYLDMHQLSYTERDGVLTVRLESVMESTDMLVELKPYLENFEVRNGSLEDVMLTVTSI